MTVFENIAFGLRVQPRGERPPRAEIARRSSELLELVQLDGFGERFPEPALRRPAAARGAGPRAGDRAAACCCSTSRSARSTPRCARSCGAGCAALHDEIGVTTRLRHPRSGRGAGARRPGRGDEQAAGSSRSARPARSTTTGQRLRAGFVGESSALPVEVSDGRIRLGDQVLDLRTAERTTGSVETVHPPSRHVDRSGRQRRAARRRQARSRLRPTQRPTSCWMPAARIR